MHRRHEGVLKNYLISFPIVSEAFCNHLSNCEFSLPSIAFFQGEEVFQLFYICPSWELLQSLPAGRIQQQFSNHHNPYHNKELNLFLIFLCINHPELHQWFYCHVGWKGEVPLPVECLFHHLKLIFLFLFFHDPLGFALFFSPPKGALVWEESIFNFFQSIPLRSSYLATPVCQSFKKTPSRTQV